MGRFGVKQPASHPVAAELENRYINLSVFARMKGAKSWLTMYLSRTCVGLPRESQK
jgi:hypothetical protein